MGKQPYFDDAALQAAATLTAESLLSSLPVVLPTCVFGAVP